MKMNLSYLLLPALSLSVACSQLDNFEEDTKSLDKTTREMQSKADNLNEIALALFPQIRSGDTIKIRNESFDILENRKKKLGSKFVAAAIYFQALEYQLWTANYNYDSENVLSHMLVDAVDEFQGRMHDVYREIDPRKMSPTKEGYWQNYETAFYALAMTMDRSHHFQRELQKKYPDVKFYSFYDVLKLALEKEMQGVPLNQHEDLLLAGMNKEMIIELLKARVDIMSALALKDLVEVREMDLSQKSKAAIFMITGGRLGKMDIPETIPGMNGSTKNNIQMYLEKAMETKKFLERLSVDHEVEKTVHSSLKEVDFSDHAKADPQLLLIKTYISQLIEE